MGVLEEAGVERVAVEHGLDTTLSRHFCGQCRSVLGAQPATGDFLLALGCIEDESVPTALAVAWQSSFRTLAAEHRLRTAVAAASWPAASSIACAFSKSFSILSYEAWYDTAL